MAVCNLFGCSWVSTNERTTEILYMPVPMSLPKWGMWKTSLKAAWPEIEQENNFKYKISSLYYNVFFCFTNFYVGQKHSERPTTQEFEKESAAIVALFVSNDGLNNNIIVSSLLNLVMNNKLKCQNWFSPRSSVLISFSKITFQLT